MQVRKSREMTQDAQQCGSLCSHADVPLSPKRGGLRGQSISAEGFSTQCVLTLRRSNLSSVICHQCLLHCRSMERAAETGTGFLSCCRPQHWPIDFIQLEQLTGARELCDTAQLQGEDPIFPIHTITSLRIRGFQSFHQSNRSYLQLSLMPILSVLCCSRHQRGPRVASVPYSQGLIIPDVICIDVVNTQRCEQLETFVSAQLLHAFQKNPGWCRKSPPCCRAAGVTAQQSSASSCRSIGRKL